MAGRGNGATAHQLSNGLYVSGQPDRYKDKGSIMSVPQMPYTGGDIKKSGELGKMLNIPVDTTASAKAGGRRSGSGNGRGVASSSSHSGPTSSGPLNSSGAPWVPGKSAGTFSGPFSGPLSSSSKPTSGVVNVVKPVSGPLKTSGPQVVLPATG